MIPDQLKSARESYGYIPARLIRVGDDDEAKLTWKSLKLDMEVLDDTFNGQTVLQAHLGADRLLVGAQIAFWWSWVGRRLSRAISSCSGFI
jgi:hypothetical protein